MEQIFYAMGEEGTCHRCGTTDGATWWKCCPLHTSMSGDDVLCPACALFYHPKNAYLTQNPARAVTSKPEWWTVHGGFYTVEPVYNREDALEVFERVCKDSWSAPEVTLVHHVVSRTFTREIKEGG